MTRILSVVFIVMGVTKLVLAILLLREGDPHGQVTEQLDTAGLWLVAGGTWLGLSRLWGELAESKAAPPA